MPTGPRRWHSETVSPKQAGATTGAAVVVGDALTRVDRDFADRVVLALADPASSVLPRHRHDLGREEVRRRQQARILAAVVNEVADRGYDRVTVAGIGRRAGVSSKTFYEVYADKEQAFLALYIVLDYAIELLGEALDASATVDDALDVGIELQLRLFADLPMVTRVLALDALGASASIVARRVESLDRYASTVARTAARFGHHPSPELVTAAIGGISELVFRRLLAGEGDRLRELFPTVRNLLLRLFSPD